MADVIYLRSYDDRSRSDDESARKVMEATVELLREVPYSSVTLRSIAKRASVAHREVRTHFRSKDAIVAEVCLKRLRAAPWILDVEQAAQERIAAQFSQLVMLLADEPGLAAQRTAVSHRALICERPRNTAGGSVHARGSDVGDTRVRVDRRVGPRELRWRQVPTRRPTSSRAWSPSVLPDRR